MPAHPGRERARLRRVGVVVLAFQVAIPLAASAIVTKKVQATGVAAVVHGDRAAACEQARQAALREAVEEGVGVLVSSVTRVQNYAVIDERILSGTRGYVRSYDIVERADADGGAACRVTLEAVVDLGELHRDLDALELAITASGNPRVLCVGVERRAGDSAPLEWGVLGPEIAKVLGAMTESLDVSAMPEDTVPPEADIVVRAMGTVTATDATIPFSGQRLTLTGLAAATASLRVEVHWADEGRAIATLDTVGRGAGPDARVAGERALRHGASLLADRLRKALAEDLQRRAYAGRLVQVVAEGGSVGSAVDELTRDLSACLGLSGAMRLRAVDGGRVVFEVRTPLDAFDLARRLSARGLPRREVSILQVTPNRLRVAVAAATPNGTP